VEELVGNVKTGIMYLGDTVVKFYESLSDEQKRIILSFEIGVIGGLLFKGTITNAFNKVYKMLTDSYSKTYSVIYKYNQYLCVLACIMGQCRSVHSRINYFIDRENMELFDKIIGIDVRSEVIIQNMNNVKNLMNYDSFGEAVRAMELTLKVGMRCENDKNLFLYRCLLENAYDDTNLLFVNVSMLNINDFEAFYECLGAYNFKFIGFTYKKEYMFKSDYCVCFRSKHVNYIFEGVDVNELGNNISVQPDYMIFVKRSNKKMKDVLRCPDLMLIK